MESNRYVAKATCKDKVYFFKHQDENVEEGWTSFTQSQSRKKNL